MKEKITNQQTTTNQETMNKKMKDKKEKTSKTKSLKVKSPKFDFFMSFVIVVLTAAIMFTTTFTVYSVVAKPEFYSRYMTLGNKYIEEGNYQEAIIAFEKAIKIEEKTVEARLGIASAYIGIGDVDTAIDFLKEARDIEPANKGLLLSIIDMLKDVDSDAAYEFLREYVERYGSDNVESDIKELYDSAGEAPRMPEILPAPGKYTKPVSVKLNSEKVIFGQAVYYTTDGSDPKKDDVRYSGPISVDKSVTIKFRGYNAAGEVTDIVEAEYVIDAEALSKAEEIVAAAEKEMEDTKEGTKPGDCVAGAKDEVLKLLEDADKTLNEKVVTVDDANDIYTSINDALEKFKTKIIPSTQKGKLQSEIQKAESILASAVEGSEPGKYKSGSKNTLSGKITNAKKVLENLLAKQSEIDNTVTYLSYAITEFKSKKVTEEEYRASIGPCKVPTIVPSPGKYTKPLTVKLELDSSTSNNTVYYTKDGSDPDKGDKKYSSGVSVNDSVTIKFRAYNVLDDASNVVSASYVIDPKPLEKAEKIIADAKKEIDKVEEGTKAGDCVEGAKDDVLKAIEKGKKKLKEKIVSVDDANNVYASINTALQKFRTKIIPSTNKEELKNEIKKAKELLESAVEGNDVGQYRSGAKDSLNNKISSAKQVRDNPLATQSEIDEATATLHAGISRFETKKITEEDKIIEEAGAKTGTVTVSMLWNTTDDLDLHVTSPSGDTIYYGNRVGLSGGTLDVDRQVSEFVDNPVENIYWDNPPSGTYTVKVNVFTKRSSGSIPFKIRTVINGESKVYTLSTDGGTVDACTFTY